MTPEGYQSDLKVTFWGLEMTPKQSLLSRFGALNGSFCQGWKSHFKVTFWSFPAPGAVAQRRFTTSVAIEAARHRQRAEYGFGEYGFEHRPQ